MYTKYRPAEKTQDAKKSKPRGGWDEDDSGMKVRQNGSNGNYGSQGNYGRTSYDNPTGNSGNVSNYKAYSGPSSGVSNDYKLPENENIKKSTISMEQKLIEDLIQPTGISLRPNETQLKDFTKRARNLDRDLIFSYLSDKLSNYETMGDNSGIKTLTKILYVIEQLLQSGLNDLSEKFSEKQDLLENIRGFYSNNKKICEVINSNINILNPNTKVRNKTGGVNLLGEESGRENGSLNYNLKVNLFDELTSTNTHNTNNMTNTQNNIFNIFETENKTKEKANEIPPNNNSHGATKSFSFIKKSANDNSSTASYLNNQPKNELNQIFSEMSLGNIGINSNEASQSNQNIINPQISQGPAQPKKNFNFIKSKEHNNSSIKPNSQLGTIFDTTNSNINVSNNNGNTFNADFFMGNSKSASSDIPTIDLTKPASADIDEVFGKRNNVDIRQITNNYNQNFGNLLAQGKPYESQNIDVLMGSHFDYSKVNDHIDASKTNGQKDHFSFVNDLLKKK